jgi:hypothetical protein
MVGVTKLKTFDKQLAKKKEIIMLSKSQTPKQDKTSPPQRRPNPTAKAPAIGQSPLASIIQRAEMDPSTLTQSDIIQLQRTIGNLAVAQLLAEPTQAPPVQKSENKTGLPDKLKTGIENLSGLSMDDVRVQYNSSKPAQLQALAYTQGTDIHVGPGQERHLPHEGWHVVQQRQGRVKPTMQMSGEQINDEVGLEREADVMGGKALQRKAGFRSRSTYARSTHQTNDKKTTQKVKKRPGPKLTIDMSQIERRSKSDIENQYPQQGFATNIASATNWGKKIGGNWAVTGSLAVALHSNDAGVKGPSVSIHDLDILEANPSRALSQANSKPEYYDVPYEEADENGNFLGDKKSMNAIDVLPVGRFGNMEQKNTLYGLPVVDIATLESKYTGSNREKDKEKIEEIKQIKKEAR